MAKYQAKGYSQHIDLPLAADKKKGGSFNISSPGEVKTDFSLVLESLSLRHAWILLPVKSFLELLYFKKSILFAFIIFFFFFNHHNIGLGGV